MNHTAPRAALLRRVFDGPREAAYAREPRLTMLEQVKDSYKVTCLRYQPGRPPSELSSSLIPDTQAINTIGHHETRYPTLQRRSRSLRSFGDSDRFIFQSNDRPGQRARTLS